MRLPYTIDEVSLKKQLEALPYIDEKVLAKIIEASHEKLETSRRVDHILSAIRGLSLLSEHLENPHHPLHHYLTHEHSTQLKNEDMSLLEVKKQSAAQHLATGEYRYAHFDLEYILEKSDIKNQERMSLLQDYILTGYIHYGMTNEMSGLRNLIHKIDIFSTNLDSHVWVLYISLLQELGTRATSIEELEKAVALLESVKSTNINTKILYSNALGLAYRRVGERNKLELLKKSQTVLQEALTNEIERPLLHVDILNNLGITQIRIYEATKQEYFLDEAKKSLNEGLDIDVPIENIESFIIRPKLLNNLGNYYKQKFFIHNTAKYALRALAQYEAAEMIWTKKQAPYEWGMLQKNKAAVKFYLAKTNDDLELMEEVVSDCLMSIKYRTITDAPYQWTKTTQVAFQAFFFMTKKGHKMNAVEVFLREIDQNIHLWEDPYLMIL